MASRALRGLGIATGLAASAVGVAFAAERVAARRIRAQDDPDAFASLVPPMDTLQAVTGHDGGSISVVSRGEGPTVVLSHGVTLSVRTWVKQMEDLPAQGFRVVAFDHRGHGQSTVGDQGHTLEALAWDMRSVLEALDLRDVVLVGHSMGGVAVQMLCLRFPEVVAERVAGIVLLSTLAKTHLSGNRRLAAALERLTSSFPDSSRMLSARELGLVVCRLGFGRHPQPSHVELTRQMILACDPETRRAAPAVLLGLDLTDSLPSIAVPTLVIGGTADLITPPSESRRIARLVPGARLELLEGAGHMLMLERTETVNALITDFATAVQQPARSTGTAAAPA